MSNEKNLTRAGIEIDSTEKAQRLGALGGAASGRSKRAKKKLREIAVEFMSMPASTESVMRVRKKFPGIPDGITNADLMTLAQMTKANNGDAKAYELLRGTSGQDPVKGVSLSGGIDSGPVKVDKNDLKEALSEIKDLV